MPACASKDRWLLSVDEGKQAVDLLSALREARRPFDEEQERVRAERDREDAEREALRTLGAMLADPLRVQLDNRELTAEERRGFDRLVRHHLAGQLDRVRDLAERYGEGPALRKERKRLQGGALPDRNDPSWRLPEEARRDGDARAKQERLREDYLGGREQRARQLAKAQGIVGRLRNRPETFLVEVDRRALRLCRACEEIAYPDPEWARYERAARPDFAGRCHFCGAEELAKIEPATEEGGRL